MLPKTNIHCLLFGHNIDDDLSRESGIEFCFHCRRDERDAPLPFTFPDTLRALRSRIRQRYARIVRYVRPCSDCGRRFGRHDDDCPPF